LGFDGLVGLTTAILVEATALLIPVTANSEHLGHTEKDVISSNNPFIGIDCFDSVCTYIFMKDCSFDTPNKLILFTPTKLKSSKTSFPDASENYW